MGKDIFLEKNLKISAYKKMVYYKILIFFMICILTAINVFVL